jgi:hypothetical protein
MSLTLSRQVDQQHPELLQQNINATCYQFVVYLIQALRSQGHRAYHVCKTAGEGQYTPPGFQPREVTGLDGKKYICTGVSHDALWCDDLQFDTIARGNDSPDPISHPDGSHMTGEAVWNAIPSQHWRPQNPPLMDGNGPPPEPPEPQPPIVKPYPGDPVWDAVGVTLFADYAQAGQAPNPQMGRWFGRTIWDATEGDESGAVLTVEASIKKHRAEWRAVLGLPPV